jgi:uncharacterized protein
VTGRRPLLVGVTELLRRPASRKPVRVQAPAEGLHVVDSRVPDGAEVDVDLELESMADGITVTGTVSAPWEGTCRRCLVPVTGRLEVPVRELYQHHPTSEDAFEFSGDQIDLEPLVREALLLELPLAPVCSDTCAGLCPQCGANRNEVDCGHEVVLTDPRWGALDALRESLEERPE